ncbi:DNA integrity scanning diadenylate cyclase DisA [uncultured Tessaracoccus sp.]|uniref:DNA integrity scanning diadenylate cyclase DisA n=1 Tax=uncultured Tessaracoccus sp. TaxID=905023 RepID=UPI0025DFBA5A|nr:DNA integrity scanning diadenylate cyclase DisA [uncultured Tessaracoccus sp.]
MSITMLQRHLKQLAPGTPLRAGIDRILHGRTGALIVMGNNRHVARISSGGFQIGVDFSAQALRELAKLDGAIILSNDLTRIVAAGVHLVPAGDLPTAETGTRHRSADRTAQAAGVPVVSVSASMGTVSLFLGGRRHLVEKASDVISRGTQTLAALTSVVQRLEESLSQFTSLEVADQVTLRDLVAVAHRYELARRLSAEMEFHISILGVEGRLLAMQHAELAAPLADLAAQLAADFAHNLADPEDFDLAALENFTPEELLGAHLIAEHLGFGPQAHLEQALATRGHRVLTTVGRLPRGVVDLLVPQHTLQELFALSRAQLMEIEGVGERRARLIRDALLRIGESTYASSEGR